MFTGIIQGLAQVKAINRQEGLYELVEELPLALSDHLIPGISIAHNGCCLTLTKSEGRLAYFDIMQKTLQLTNLKHLQEGDWINIERAAKFGDEIGGHLLSGHISGEATLVERQESPGNLQLTFELPAELIRFVILQGFIAVDGASLTVSKVNAPNFSINLIPETFERTTLAKRLLGEKVNIEIDATTQAVVTTVERLVATGQWQFNEPSLN